MPYSYPYPRPALTVDIVVLCERDRRSSVLLVRRRNAPFAGVWALPGGFVDIDEGLEDAARRELREETSLEISDLALVDVFDAVDRDPRERTISVAFVGRVPEAATARAASDAAEARWFYLDELPDLAFDHAQILEAARR